MSDPTDPNANQGAQPQKAPQPKTFAIGPGIIMAATGLGAGDLVAAAKLNCSKRSNAAK